MILTVTIEDIIRRCLWSDYKRFILKDKSEQEIKILIQENKPVVLSENDAYAIGLIKVIETDNLIHRFTVHMKEMINIKSTIFDKNVYMSFKIVENELESFKKRFPDSWVPDTVYEKSVNDIVNHINRLQEKLKDIEVHEFKIKDKTVRYFLSKDIKKLLDN